MGGVARLALLEVDRAGLAAVSSGPVDGTATGASTGAARRSTRGPFREVRELTVDRAIMFLALLVLMNSRAHFGEDPLAGSGVVPHIAMLVLGCGVVVDGELGTFLPASTAGACASGPG